MTTRVRFAPSPTGFLHLGSARTALFNWLFAKSTGGEYILRIEDTDKVRSEARFLEEILLDLKWMGLDWDSEPIYQSSRFELYREKAESLLAEGKAYREGEAIIYKVAKGNVIKFNDMVHGEIEFNTDQIKDQVMIKSDGSPAYNFCCVVDDADMVITHIIRGDDHLSNTPKQIIFYEALGVKAPEFGHMPLMMGADGAKLSKRHGAVSVEDYKKEGFLPEALVNYLMLLGWSPGDDKEILTLKEAVKLFKVEDMTGVQARFDDQKLKWMNGEYLMKKNEIDLVAPVKKKLIEMGIEEKNINEVVLENVMKLYKMRGKTFTEIAELVDCFFTDEFEYEEKGKRKFLDPEERKQNLKEFAEKLSEINEFTHDKIEEVCREIAERKDLKAADIIHPARMAISGKTRGAGLFEMMEILGKENVLSRIQKIV